MRVCEKQVVGHEWIRRVAVYEYDSGVLLVEFGVGIGFWRLA